MTMPLIFSLACLAGTSFALGLTVRDLARMIAQWRKTEQQGGTEADRALARWTRTIRKTGWA